MRVGRTVQPVSYELRLPDAVQAASLRVLDASRIVINATVAALWERLDDFGERETKYAYKQVTALIASSDPHGDRQWRCEAEQAGRKKRFALVLPLLEQGMIGLDPGKWISRNSRALIKQLLRTVGAPMRTFHGHTCYA